MKQTIKSSKAVTLAFKILLTSILGLSTPLFASSPSDRCEVIFADSQAAVLRTGARTGGPAVISKANKLSQPFGLAVGKNGEFFVSDTGCLGLLGIDPKSGEQRLISSGGILGMPLGIAVEHSGMILVANAESLVRVNPETGAQTILSTGNLFRVPLAVAVSENGDIYVVDALGPVIRVDSASGAQTLISSGGVLHRPQGIAVKGKHIYVTDVAGMNFGVGRIIQIDIRSGRQNILSEGGNLVGPVGITVEPKGGLIVGDPYTVNPESADIFDGGIIRIDENSGVQTLIARGSDIFVNPRGVAVVQKAGN